MHQVIVSRQGVTLGAILLLQAAVFATLAILTALGVMPIVGSDPPMSQGLARVLAAITGAAGAAGCGYIANQVSWGIRLSPDSLQVRRLRGWVCIPWSEINDMRDDASTTPHSLKIETSSGSVRVFPRPRGAGAIDEMWKSIAADSS